MTPGSNSVATGHPSTSPGRIPQKMQTRDATIGAQGAGTAPHAPSALNGIAICDPA
jgi:hypothetical protein